MRHNLSTLQIVLAKEPYSNTVFAYKVLCIKYFGSGSKLIWLSWIRIRTGNRIRIRNQDTIAISTYVYMFYNLLPFKVHNFTNIQRECQKTQNLMRILNPLKDAKKYSYYLMLITFCGNFFVQFLADLKSAQTSALFYTYAY
jgi:hypothetical protein